MCMSCIRQAGSRAKLNYSAIVGRTGRSLSINDDDGSADVEANHQ